MRIGDSTPVMAQTPDRPSQDLRKAAEGFEAIFLTTFLKAARSASLGEDLMGSQAVDSARDMFETEVSQLASSRAGLGIADAVERQFKPYQKG